MSSTNFSLPIVLVIGASGETGRKVVNKLVSKGISVRILYRSKPLGILGIEEYQGDVRDMNSLSNAFIGVHTIISCLGNRSYFGKNGMYEVDVLGTSNIVALAKKNQVKHFILMSAFGIDRSSIFLKLFSLLLNNYFFYKEQAEKLVKNSGVPFTIVRPHELRNVPPPKFTLIESGKSTWPAINCKPRHSS